MHPGALADGFEPFRREPELAHSFQLISYHRRGYKHSARPEASGDVARHAADAAALLRYLDVESAHVVGHSAGGVVALQLAIEAPGLVQSLALLEPALIQVPSGREFVRRRILPAG